MTYQMRIFGTAILLGAIALASIAPTVMAADWVLQDTGSASGVFYDITSLSSNRKVAVGWNGQAYHTEDSGFTWSAGTTGVTGTLYAVDSASITKTIAVGESGTILTSADYGATWTAQTSGTTKTLFDIDMYSSTVGIAVGEIGTMLYTSDGGTTWTASATSIPKNMLGVHMISSTVAWAVGDGGRIYKTSNSGATWSLYTGGTSKVLQDVKFISSSVGYIVGEGGTIIKTTDGGTTWNAVSVTDLGIEDLYSFEYVTSNLLKFVGDDVMFTSTDAGSTWTKTSFIGDDLRAVAWSAVNNAFAVGRNASADAIVYVYDAYAPDAPTNLAITEGSPTNQVSPSFTWNASTDDETGIGRYLIKFDDGIWDSESTTTSFTVTGVLSEGEHIMYIKAVDEAGNESAEANLEFRIDITDPVIPALVPNSATVGTAVEFFVTPIDDSVITGCDLYINSIYKSEMINHGDGNFGVSYTFTTGGTNFAYARCTDEANNVNNGTSTSVAVSSTTITCYADNDGDGYGNGSASSAVESTTCPTGKSSNGSDWCDGDSSAHTYAQCFPSVSAEEGAAVDTTDTGSLIKSACPTGNESDDPCRAVYYYGDDGKRHAFPNEKVYFTWFEDFADIVVVSDDLMASISLGRNITYHSGTKMVKFVSVRTVYAVSAGGELRPIASEDVAEDLYGIAWNQQIDDISDAFFSNYSFGADILDASDYDVDAERDSVSTINDDLDS
ncbi:MAG: YCF48-related protein [Candidatus Uhrbacteria bacterium]|nr:YCF48-related protein [Candidatus Uhrbacteria bacterium]